MGGTISGWDNGRKSGILKDCWLADANQPMFVDGPSSSGMVEGMDRKYLAASHRSAVGYVARRLCLLVSCLFVVAACAGTAGVGGLGNRVAPVALTFPAATAEARDFPNYKNAAEAVADSYVRVRITAPTVRAGPYSGSDPGGVITAASGILLDARGFVITAAHIALAVHNDAQVITRDGRVFKARILSVDPDRELALLRVPPFPGMRPVRISRAIDTRAGDPVFAIGTPGNRPGVVSVGRIQTPRIAQRVRYAPYGFDNGVRLDMEIEPGFSGGPLFNRKGELIGMVASILLGDTSKANYVSPRVAFAVPAEDIVAYLLENSRRSAALHQ